MRNTYYFLITVILFISCKKENQYPLDNLLDGSSPAIKDGEDWSLPEAVVPDDYAAVFYMDYSSGKEIYFKGIGRTFSWAQLNPGENTYDFSVIRDALDLASNSNRMLIMRLKNSVVSRKDPWSNMVTGPFIPQWVLDKHLPTTFYTLKDDSHEEGNVDIDSDHFIKVVAFWEEQVQQEFKKFVGEFGNHDFFADEHFGGLYIQAISTSFGEECWLEPKYATDARLNYGMTYDTLENAIKDRMDWWADAAGKHVHKLAWVGFGWMGMDWLSVGDRVDAYALDKGIGWRGGGVEYYNRYVPNRSEFIEQNNGYAIIDWEHPVRAESRFFGEEGENAYLNEPAPAPKHMVQSMIMRSSQIGFNFLWISEPVKNLAPDMMRWYSLTAGKHPHESPDAICWLRQDQTYYAGEEHIWKNMERFLHQRDREGSKTRPVRKIERKAFETDPQGKHYDWSARQTDIKNEQDGILFLVDDVFLEGINPPFDIKVTYIDTEKCEWNISIQTVKGSFNTEIVNGKGDGKPKTATFTINEIPDMNGDPPHHFRINHISGGNVTVKYVRIVK